MDPLLSKKKKKSPETFGTCVYILAKSVGQLHTKMCKPRYNCETVSHSVLFTIDTGRQPDLLL